MGNSRGFEKGAGVFWAAEHRGTYRAAPTLCWRFVALEGALRGGLSRRGPIALSELLGYDFGHLGITLEPRDRSQVRVTTPGAVTFHAPGDSRAEAHWRVVDVPYGSVLRVGELLLAPVFAEQRESIEEGLLELPLVPLLSPAEDERPIEEDDDRSGEARRRVATMWATALGLAAAFAVVASCLLLILPRVLDWLATGRFCPPYRYGHSFLCIPNWEWSEMMGLTALQWVAAAIFALPFLAAVVRWSRTPGDGGAYAAPALGTGLLVKVGRGLRILWAALAILGVPWACALAGIALMDFDGPMWIDIGALSIVAAPFLFCLCAFLTGLDLRRVAVGWMVGWSGRPADLGADPLGSHVGPGQDAVAGTP